MSQVALAIVVGSTRPGRRAPAVADWVLSVACQHDRLRPVIVDVAHFGLPVLDEPIPAAANRYQHRHSIAWSETIASYDAFIFVTPEYNHSMPGALKNAIDYRDCRVIR